MANLPNILTVFRIVLIPLLVVLLTDPRPTASVLAALTFFVASLSDFFDGYLARRWGISTPLGQLLDPLADKLIVAAALIMLAGMAAHAGRCPRGWRRSSSGVSWRSPGCAPSRSARAWWSPAEELGKYKMIFQMFAIHGLLLHYPFLGVDWHVGGMYFLWIALVLSLWSGIDYHVKVIRQLMRGQVAASKA